MQMHLLLFKMTIDEDKLFLTLQRQKDQPGCMGGIDFHHPSTEKRREMCESKENNAVILN